MENEPRDDAEQHVLFGGMLGDAVWSDEQQDEEVIIIDVLLCMTAELTALSLEAPPLLLTKQFAVNSS